MNSQRLLYFIIIVFFQSLNLLPNKTDIKTVFIYQIITLKECFKLSSCLLGDLSTAGGIMNRNAVCLPSLSPTLLAFRQTSKYDPPQTVFLQCDPPRSVTERDEPWELLLANAEASPAKQASPAQASVFFVGTHVHIRQWNFIHTPVRLLKKRKN